MSSIRTVVTCDECETIEDAIRAGDSSGHYAKIMHPRMQPPVGWIELEVGRYRVPKHSPAEKKRGTLCSLKCAKEWLTRNMEL